MMGRLPSAPDDKPPPTKEECFRRFDEILAGGYRAVLVREALRRKGIEQAEDQATDRSESA